MNASGTHSPRAKWAWYGRYWLVAAPLVYLAMPIFVGKPPDQWARTLGEGDYAVGMAVFLVLLAGLQALILRPMGSPWPARAAGKSFLASVVTGALLVSLLVVGFVCIAGTAIWILGGENYLKHGDDGWFWGALFASVLLGWATATPLLLAYARRRAGEDVLAQIAAGLFKGTAIEAIALIPLDVMVRMRSRCYCGEGSFIALLLWLAVGLVVLGPAILFVLWHRPQLRTNPTQPIR